LGGRKGLPKSRKQNRRATPKICRAVNKELGVKTLEMPSRDEGRKLKTEKIPSPKGKL